MPKITEFDAGNVALRPSEVGVEATAGAARRIGAFYNQAAEAKGTLGQRLGGALRDAGDVAVKVVDHQQISTGAAHGAEMFDSLIQSKDEAIKGIDPNDPAYGPKVEAAVKQWREQTLEPSLQQFQEGFTTERSQAWAEHFVDQTRQHMFRQSTADVSTAVGIGVHNNVKGLINSATNTALRDPASVDAQIDLVKHSIGGIVDSSPMKGIDAAKVKTDVGERAIEQIVKAGAFGAIQKSGDPEATAAEWVKRYPQYINGQEALTLGKAAKSQAKADFLTQKQSEDYQHTQQVRDGQDRLGKVFTDNVSYDNTGNPVIKPGFFRDAMSVAASNPTAAEHARTLLNWGEAQQNKKIAAVSDPVTKQTLLDRFTSNNPPSEVDILRAQASGKLSNPDGTVLNNLRKSLEERPLKDPIYKATMDGVKGALGTDPIGHEKFASFFQTFVPAYLALPPEQQAKALDINDPNSLLSKTMAPLKRSAIQMILDKKAYGLIDPGTAASALATGETIGGVKPTAIRAGGQIIIPEPAKQKLRDNPDLKAQFDAKYGSGEADKVLAK
jgi:hypothetical protein